MLVKGATGIQNFKRQAEIAYLPKLVRKNTMTMIIMERAEI